MSALPNGRLSLSFLVTVASWSTITTTTVGMVHFRAPGVTRARFARRVMRAVYMLMQSDRMQGRTLSTSAQASDHRPLALPG